MGGRVVLLVTSPRLPAGVLTAQAWDLVRANPVYAAAENDQVEALRAAGVGVTVIEPTAVALLAELAAHGAVVWLAGPAGDEHLAREVGLRLAREPGLAELELVYGSWDPAGARLLDAMAVIDRLLAPGGDAWLRQYTPAGGGSPADLAQYLLEEAYEAYDAVRDGSAAEVREELGDLLFQVVLHARLGELAAAGGAGDGEDGRAFTIDDVAGDLVAKLVRRNPHVFGEVDVADVEEITHNWERIKRAEKARSSAMDGIPLSQPALSLAAKVLSRAERAGLGGAHPAVRSEEVEPPPGPAAEVPPASAVEPPPASEAELGVRLFALVAQARAAGLDAEGALRRVTIDAMRAFRAAEFGDRDGRA